MPPSTQPSLLTPGQVFARFRRMPEMQDLVRANYLDDDLLTAAHRFYDSEEFAAVLGYTARLGHSAPGGVLDLGGGNGVASLAWAWAGYCVVLVEPDLDNIVGLGAARPAVSDQKLHVSLCGAFAEGLPFPDRTFDIVYTRQVLHHVSNLSLALTEIRRILKPGGIYMATREHVISREDDLEHFLAQHPVHRYTQGENARLLRDYKGSIRRAGFCHLLVLGSYDSVINYFPRTEKEFLDRCYTWYRKYTGSRVARLLVAHRTFVTIAGRYLSWRDQTPGRMYSFIVQR